jgi:branched-chain amino acid transport system substrate-binding protein
MTKGQVIGRVLLLALVIIALVACQAGGSPAALVYVSLPLQGPKIGASLRQGIELAFAEMGYQIGPIPVELVILDNGDANGQWQPDLETANAQAAVTNQAVAYIGPMDSGAAKISLPILNRAGILQISPSASWPGLTKPGFAQGEPGIFYPTGKRTFFRPIPTDEAQAPAGALWARSMGLRTFYVLDDGGAYGMGAGRLFSSYAQQIGLVEIGHETVDKTAQDYSAVLEAIKRVNPDLVYFGGSVANGAARIVKQMRAAGITAQYMGPDGLMDTTLIEQAGPAAEGTYVTFVGLPPDRLSSEVGQKFYEAYEARYHEAPEAYTQYGYDAGRAVIEAIRHAPALDGAGVLQGLRSVPALQGVGGTYTFDARGDTSLMIISGSEVKNGQFEFVQTLMVP